MDKDEKTPNPRPALGVERFEQAAAEVDRTLLRECLARTPRERLRVATRAQRALAKFRRHASS
jgi:hypothetical protein